MTPEELSKLRDKGALAFFKKHNPHLSEDAYFHAAETSQTIAAYSEGFDAALEAMRAQRRVHTDGELAASYENGWRAAESAQDHRAEVWKQRCEMKEKELAALEQKFLTAVGALQSARADLSQEHGYNRYLVNFAYIEKALAKLAPKEGG